MGYPAYSPFATRYSLFAFSGESVDFGRFLPRFALTLCVPRL
jgi:hypothetical protein